MRLSILAALTVSAAFWASAGQCADEDAAPAAPIKLNLTLLDARDALDVSRLQGSAIEQPIEPRTAVEHRFTPDGVTGSAGYLCGIGGIGPDGEEARVGPASAFQHFGTFLGATLAVPIR